MKGPVANSKTEIRLHASRGTGARAKSSAVPVGAPTMPAYLSALAKSVWRKTVPILKRANLLATTDGGAVTAYCLVVAEIEECTRKIAEDGLMVESHGQKYPHPLLKTRAAAQQRVKALAESLGLTALSRKRGRVETGETLKVHDPMDKFLNRPKRKGPA